MLVRSKLADVEFHFGHFQYKKDHLIIHSAPEQNIPTKVYVSPNDILSAIGCALKNPRVWLYLIGFPFFLIRYRRRHAAKRQAQQG